jgi:RNA polymerase sigma-70 factor (ECF subfamily)
MDLDPGELDPPTLERLRHGDLAALETAYLLFGGRVLRLARAVLADATDAEDALQEVFLKVLERVHQFDGRARFSTWLHRLVVNHCLSRLERARIRRADALPEADEQAPVDHAPSPLEAAQRSESRARLEALLRRLPPEQRAAFVLRELEGLSYAEIAAALGVPEGTVMSRLYRARARLTEIVGPHCSLPYPRREATLRSLP